MGSVYSNVRTTFKYEKDYWREIKSTKPLLTNEAKERISDKLLTSLLSEKEILVTYFEDGYILTSYMTVVHINPVKQIVICTDAFIKLTYLTLWILIEIT